MHQHFEIEINNQYNLPENAKYSTCPLCSHTRKKSTQKCLQLFWDTGLAKCSHCGELLQLHTYKKQKHEAIKVYQKPAWKNYTDLSNRLVKWFEGRKISQTTLKAMKITEGLEYLSQVGREVNTVQFNYIRNGELINIKYRDGAKNFKMFKDAEKIFYNLDCCKYATSIAIVEGEIDVLSFVEAGFLNVVSIPNGSTNGNVNLDYLDNCIDYFENKETIYLALDNDGPGQNVQKELIRRLGAERCKIVDFNGCKDANEYLCQYGSEKLLETIVEAKNVPLDGVTSVNDFMTELMEYAAKGMQQGFRIGKNYFDSKFSTYTGQYIVVTGKPSSGKSDFVDEMCIGYAVKYGWRVAYASPENKPNQIHAGKLLSKLLGKWINRDKLYEAERFKRALDFVDNKYRFIDLDETYDLDRVLEKGRELVVRHGIKCLVIDPYNKIRDKANLNKGINDYTNDYLVKIEEFCRKYDVLAILVAHPRKPDVKESKTYEPTFYDVKGGGEMYDMSPHGLLVHRVGELTKIKVLKCKFSHLGENNAEAWFKWDKFSGRYDECDSEGLLYSLNYVTSEFEEEKIRLNPTREELEAEKMKANLEFDNFNIINDVPF
jgi:twinkle protein